MDQPQPEKHDPAVGDASGKDASPILSFSVNLRRLRSACASASRKLAHDVTVLSVMYRKPRLMALWLATARRAQVALGTALLALTLVVPPTLTWISDQLYPTNFEQDGFFQRVFDTRRPVANPLREVRYDQFLLAAWALGLGAVLILLLDHAPRAVSIGRKRAAALSAEAEKLAAVDAEQSVRLRRIADGLVIDDDLMRDLATAEREARKVAAKTQVIARSRPRDERQTFVGADRRYRLDGALGSGGMGVVHAGTDTLLKRPVALKQLFSHLVEDKEHSNRFRQEALALASLSHPHIVTIHDLVEFDSHFWIVMELLTGGNLADKIAAEGSIPPAKCIGIVLDIAAGLDYAHGRGIVHRDVKPMNTLFTADGTPKLTDFGNAKLHDSALHTREGQLLGSPAYMSPEQITGEPIDARSDIYALGISLYQMLTGTVPFEGDLGSILAQHVTKPPRPPSAHDATIPASLDEIVLKMLGKAPQDRFQDCRALLGALGRAAQTTAVPRARMKKL